MCGCRVRYQVTDRVCIFGCIDQCFRACETDVITLNSCTITSLHSFWLYFFIFFPVHYNLQSKQSKTQTDVYVIVNHVRNGWVGALGVELSMYRKETKEWIELVAHGAHERRRTTHRSQCVLNRECGTTKSNVKRAQQNARRKSGWWRRGAVCLAYQRWEATPAIVWVKTRVGECERIVW